MTKDEILAHVRLSRTAMATDSARLKAAVRHELDFEAKLQRVVKKSPLAWFGGAAALGWILAGPKRKTRVVTKVVDPQGKRVKSPEVKAAKGLGKLGLVLSLARFIFPYVRPALTTYATEHLARYAQRFQR